MNKAQKAEFRAAVKAVSDDATVKFYGKPERAPSIQAGSGEGIAFRAWREYVSITGAMDKYDEILDAVRPWRDTDSGLLIFKV